MTSAIDVGKDKPTLQIGGLEVSTTGLKYIVPPSNEASCWLFLYEDGTEVITTEPFFIRGEKGGVPLSHEVENQI